MSILYKWTALVVCMLTALQLSAQHVSAALDSTTILVGGQVGLTIDIVYPDNMDVTVKQLSDTLTKDIEIVDSSVDNITKTNGNVVIRQRYILTSFDTTLHYIPPIEMLQYPGGTASTGDMSLNVINPFQTLEVDEQSGVVKITDIMQPIDTPFDISELLEYKWWILGGLLLVAAIVVGIIMYRKYGRKGADGVVKVAKPKEPCHVIALRELEQIKEEKLWQRSMFKEYYSELTEVLRRYIVERYGVNAMESTSDEIVEMMKPLLGGDAQSKSNLESILTLSDYVKFAKMEPLPDENDMAIKYAIDFVKATTETNTQNEEVKQ